MTTTYTISGRRIRVTSEGGSVSHTTRAALERSVLDILRSEAFARGGFAALAPSTMKMIEEVGGALRLAKANGL